MKPRRARAIVVVTVAAGIFVGAASATSYATNGNANPMNVFVTNDADNPVPITGAVNVGNLPATQDVTGTVDVGNLPATQDVAGTVNVGNLPATQQVTGRVSIDGPVTTSGTTTEPWKLHRDRHTDTSYTVPPGKQLRIRTLSGRVWVDADRTGAYLILGHCDSGMSYCGTPHTSAYVPLTQIGTSNAGPVNMQDVYVGSMLVDILVPAGHRVELSGVSVLNGAAGNLNEHYLNAVGELETVP